MPKKQKADPVMVTIRARFKASELSLHDFGLKMGYQPELARQSVHRFMRTNDPRISMLRKAAEALSIELKDLIE
jgi:hypothetical protein